MVRAKHRIAPLALVAASLWCAPAAAAEGRLQPLGGAKVVVVWKSADAHSEGLELIRAGVHRTSPALLAPLIACLVEQGTRAVTTDFGFVTHEILVVEGAHGGCRANVPVEALEAAPKG
jgi:hypothetical protein